MNRELVLQQLREVVRQVAPDARALLFGSQARGEARPDSDIDRKLPIQRPPQLQRVTCT